MQCDTSLLWTLVEQSADPGEEAEAIARHLESCAGCREQLSNLGGGPTWWDDAQQWLTEIDDDAEYAMHELPPLPPVDLSFLDEPSHPEMLGRIGRYDVEGLIGRGGMGVVLRAYDSDLHRSVAVKVMAPEWAASLQARQRFAREAQAAASVAHENVIPIYNVEANATLPFLVMRYVPGMTLERWVKANAAADVATILRVSGQLAEGLAAAHRRGLVHRDIKPGNVLVGNNIDRVWITDFGLARAADSITLTRTGVIAGTPHYMSPEQARGEIVDQRSDLFSLGCVLYYLCTGRPPFDAENTLSVLHKIVSDTAAPLTAFRDDLPPSLVTLVRQLLQRSPDKRPQDCQAVIAKVNDAQLELAAGRVANPPISPSLRRILACGTLGLAGGLLAFAGLFSQSDRSVMSPVLGTAERNRVVEDGVTPYVENELTDIDFAFDNVRFRQRLEVLERGVQSLEREKTATAAPKAFLDDSRWKQDVAELQTVIERLEKTIYASGTGLDAPIPRVEN